MKPNRTKKYLLEQIRKYNEFTYFEALTWEYKTILRFYNNNVKEYQLI